MIRKKYCGTAAKAGGNGENKPRPKVMGGPYLLENNRVWRYGSIVLLGSMLCGHGAGNHAETTADAVFVLSCSSSNDLYRVMTAVGIKCARYDSTGKAVAEAPEGAGVLILADGYPKKTTEIAPAVFDQATQKNLRLYVEYPSALPSMEVGKPRHSHLERVVVSSDVFGDALKKLRLLTIHDCHFVEMQAENPYLVLAKVAGYDTAAYGLADTKSFPVLFEHSRGDVMVSTTKLSQFLTARYAPKDALQRVWAEILGWLQPGKKIPTLDWTPTIIPTYSRDAKLPEDAYRTALIRGIDWHSNARMLVDKSWKDKYHEYRRNGTVNPKDPVGPAPDPVWPAGDGEYAVMEGVSSRIYYDGTQPVRWWLRTDSIGESAIAFALRSKLDGDTRSATIAGNLLDWVYFKSGLFRNDPAKGDFGLVHWAHDSAACYGDNDIKIILSCMGTAALLDTDKWDEVLLQNILANFRTTGVHGFRLHGALQGPNVVRDGWEHYFESRGVHLAPHYQAWIWSAYLWAYDKTKDPSLLERTRLAIGMMMEAYPDRWRWTNSIQQERGRMLLPLAWLIRVDDQPQHREWLKMIATDMQKCQDASGAIREELGDLGKGAYPPPTSNAAYGASEASAIHENGDPMADMVYTCNFTFLGLHEAYAATGDKQYKEMADKLAEFFVRIQVRSDAHPELDGGWFRCFDYEKWDYWGSNADHAWGAWCIEVGWTQGWIPTVLALRELDRNLWDMTQQSKIGRHWEKVRKLMLPDDVVNKALKNRPHAAVRKPVTLAVQADPSYPGRGAASLVDGEMGGTDLKSPQWLGFHGHDLNTVIDMEQPVDIKQIAVNCLQSIPDGIYLPEKIKMAISDDGKEFKTIASLTPTMAPEAGPAVRFIESDALNCRARYIRVQAKNTGVIPEGNRGAGRQAWLFVDEIRVIDRLKENNDWKD